YNSIKSVNPSFLTIDGSRQYLYAVNEVGEFSGKPGGAVSAFAIDSRTGNLTFLNQQTSSGADPCHLIVDRRRKFLLVANYTGGNLSVLSIQRDGSLGPATDLVQHEGSSIKEQQKGPHAHCIILDASDRHALAADLGVDKVMIYRFDETTGKLKPNKQPWFSLKPGAGPRHLTLHPRGKYLYVINELDSTMSAFSYDGVNGTLRLLETVSTLPDVFSGRSYCADLHVSPSGKFLYGSNRGHDSIVVFAIDESTGRLKYLEHASTQGKWPRNFTIDPTGRFLLVANQHSDSVVTFRIDPETGRLKATGHVAEIPTPVCLKFV
ncbi:MAG: lactonase family protein, partial [Pyrinomonadaceae bacterium]